MFSRQIFVCFVSDADLKNWMQKLNVMLECLSAVSPFLSPDDALTQRELGLSPRHDAHTQGGSEVIHVSRSWLLMKHNITAETVGDERCCCKSAVSSLRLPLGVCLSVYTKCIWSESNNSVKEVASCVKLPAFPSVCACVCLHTCVRDRFRWMCMCLATRGL